MAWLSMTRLATRIGTTRIGARTALADAGLYDLVENRPTRAAHALGLCRFVEREKNDERMRFPSWNADALIERAPWLRGSEEDRARSFPTRWAAANRLRSSAITLREHRPDLAAALTPLACDLLNERIVSQTSATVRTRNAKRELEPLLHRLTGALACGSPPSPEENRELDALAGAIRWLTNPARGVPTRGGALDDPTIAAPSVDARERREYEDAHSFRLTDEERTLLASGYDLNLGEPRPADAALAAEMLVPLSRRTSPGLSPDEHRKAGAHPVRMRGLAGRSAMATSRRLANGPTIVSAHRADFAAGRLSIKTDVIAFRLVAPNGQDVERGGDAGALSWLDTFGSATTGITKRTKREDSV